MKVYAVWHTHQRDEDDEDIKFIGVYSTEDLAHGAVTQLRAQPGFRDAPEGFHVSTYMVNETHWTAGYITIPHGSDGSDL
ncbi:MAG TPA: hypothetical protein VI299_14990 [Polyangiales bacterium]